ncbi:MULTISPECIES: GntR family transcriptional regulator [unclassified Roseitalea]|uniref:GntR family transcriptional regulator n=1 Tax=unclassified Roseitalea TaxID=2639107 RepID=UPI00273E4BF2|nr:MULTISPECIES: GntR family transcriptional regulator [unclassified Roseitalea]
MNSLFSPEALSEAGRGPLYRRLARGIDEQIAAGTLRPGDSLPSERDMAALTGLSRVTVRKAVQHLVEQGRLVQHRGSGTFVAARPEKLEQSLAHLTSFTEDMARRGMAVQSTWLSRAIHAPTPDEVMALGLGAADRVVRLERVRRADGVPLAIERASLSTALLPDPDIVTRSLYEVLSARGLRPTRAVQRITAGTLEGADAALLEVGDGAAALRIERVSYLASGRVVELTRSLYRGDMYDFTAELQIPVHDAGH